MTKNEGERNIIRDYTSPPGGRTKCNRDYVSSPESGVITSHPALARITRLRSTTATGFGFETMAVTTACGGRVQHRRWYIIYF